MDLYPVTEGVTATLTADLVDEAGAAVPASMLTTLTLTLYDLISGRILNGRNKQNVLNANNVTVDNAGRLTFLMQTLDNKIVNPGYTEEQHRALFEWTFAGGSKSGRQEVAIEVQKPGVA